MGSIRSIRAASNGNTVDLWIVSEINSWVAQDFVYTCQAYGSEKEYVLNIYSPGGDPFAAFAIHDFIKANGIKATARVWGHAASAAAIIACSCERVEIGENSFIMIHNAYGGGDQDLLDSINAKQVALFKAKSGMSASGIEKLMKDETWMDAKAAKANGIADSIIKELAIAAIYKAQYMEDKPKPEGTEEVKPETAETVEQTEKAAEEAEATEATEEVEQEIPVTVPQAVEAAIKGKIIAKVKVSAEMRKAVADLTVERNTVKAQLQERVDEVTALTEKLAKAEERAVKAEGEVATMKPQIEAITAEVEKLKKLPVADAEREPKGGTGEPGSSIATPRRRSREEQRIDAREAEMRKAYEASLPTAKP